MYICIYVYVYVCIYIYIYTSGACVRARNMRARVLVCLVGINTPGLGKTHLKLVFIAFLVDYIFRICFEILSVS